MRVRATLAERHFSTARLGCRVPIALEANFIRLPKPDALGYEFLADYLTLPASVAPGTSVNLPVATSYIYP